MKIRNAIGAAVIFSLPTGALGNDLGCKPKEAVSAEVAADFAAQLKAALPEECRRVNENLQPGQEPIDCEALSDIPEELLDPNLHQKFATESVMDWLQREAFKNGWNPLLILAFLSVAYDCPELKTPEEPEVKNVPVG